MNATAALVLFALAGALAANAGAWFAFRRGAPGARGVGVLFAGYAAWLALGFWLDPAMASAARPWHALATSLALYVVLGFPAFVARQVMRK